MLRVRYQTFPAILPLLVIFLVFAAVPGYAVPILKGQAKRAAGKTAPRTIVTLGHYRDFSAAKQSASLVSSLPARLKPRFISAKSVIIIDSRTGRTLYSRSPDLPRQPASTIKILTGKIAIDSLHNRDYVPVSKKAARQPRSKVYLDPRKSYKATDLINAVLLASANDASVALAEKISGSESSFAQKMTRLAKLYGARHTICKTASGLTAKGQKTTARDLALIFRKAMQDKEFAKRMKRTKVQTSEGKVLHNHNKALWQINGSVGGKTGYTNAARQTYVGKFKRGQAEIIIAILGSETMWTDIKRLVEFGFARKKQFAAETGPGGYQENIVESGREKLKRRS